MTTEQSLVATAIASWKINLDRAEKLFFSLTDEQLEAEVAPGKNRLIYLCGHFVAIHDAMLPLLGIGPRLYPELDRPFLHEADRAVGDLPPVAAIKTCWTDVHARLLDAFNGFTPEQWTQKHTAMSEADFGVNPLRNRLAVLLSRTVHVGYHLGQAALAPTAA
jgi:hypothetical protein